MQEINIKKIKTSKKFRVKIKNTHLASGRINIPLLLFLRLRTHQFPRSENLKKFTITLFKTVLLMSLYFSDVWAKTIIPVIVKYLRYDFTN